MTSLAEFFDMGGYAFYVWSSYGLALVIMVANIIQPMFWRQRVLRSLARRSRMARRSL
jgi:heme exporter protein D